MVLALGTSGSCSEMVGGGAWICAIMWFERGGGYERLWRGKKY
jgi:hypothetical protein